MLLFNLYKYMRQRAFKHIEAIMKSIEDNEQWTSLSYEEKNHQLFLRQKALLDNFLEHGAISKAQHDKSLHDLGEKMGESE